MTGEKSGMVEPLRKPVGCPSCQRNSMRDYYPFCSERCQELDLHKWFSGSHVIASHEQADGIEET
ncbi:MAG: DNA gyrase inhibitor YacG [Rhizobiaceae bacterium]